MTSVSGNRAGGWVYVSDDPNGTLTCNSFLRAYARRARRSRWFVAGGGWTGAACVQTYEVRKHQPLELSFRAVLIRDHVRVTFRREVHDRFAEASP